jgi:hypothetical protein
MTRMIALAAVAVSAFAASAADTTPADRSCCAVVELRHTLQPRQRDVLIELFDREFVETQEAVGMRILGQFRDADEPDRFVWIRAFPDMETRRRALTSFYQGPAWKTHGKRAAATMIDSDDVLLLRPADSRGGFEGLPAARPPIGASAWPASIVSATIYQLQAGTRRGFPAFFEETVRPVLRDAGIIPVALFETEPAANNYSLLPVREGEDVFVWFASFDSVAAHAAALDRLSGSRRWAQVDSALPTYLKAPPQHLRLQPTGRSLLR